MAMRTSAHTLLRKHSKTNDAKSRAGLIQPDNSRVFRIVNAVWSALFASVFLDPLAALFTEPLLSRPLAGLGAVACAVLTLPFLSQSSIQGALRRFRESERTRLTRSSKAGVVIVIGSTILGFALKLGGLLGTANIARGVFACVVMYSLIRHALSTLKEQAKLREQFAQNPTLFVRRWEDQLIAIALLPMFLARLVSILGALQGTGGGPGAWAYFITGGLILAMLRPSPRTYTGSCRRCRQPISLALETLERCPRCSSTKQSVVTKHPVVTEATDEGSKVKNRETHRASENAGSRLVRNKMALFTRRSRN